jgi:hypothetical protein
MLLGRFYPGRSSFFKVRCPTTLGERQRLLLPAPAIRSKIMVDFRPACAILRMSKRTCLSPPGAVHCTGAEKVVHSTTTANGLANITSSPRHLAWLAGCVLARWCTRYKIRSPKRPERPWPGPSMGTTAGNNAKATPQWSPLEPAPGVTHVKGCRYGIE